MELSDREILELIAAAFVGGFVFLLGLWAWHFLDNRASHGKLHDRITDHDNRTTAASHRMTDRLYDIYAKCGGKRGDSDHWQDRERDKQ